MKKLLLLVFGLSLFMVGCTDDSGSGTDTGGGTGGSTPISVKDFDIKINDATDPANILNKITGIADNTPMSMKGGVVTIGTAGTEILTEHVNTASIAGELVDLISSNVGTAAERRTSGIATTNAKISVSANGESATFDLILVPMRGYTEKVFKTTLTSSAFKFLKPTIVNTSDINFTMTQTSIPNTMEFTGGSDGKGSTVVTKGQVVASSSPVTATLDKDVSFTYSELLDNSVIKSVYGENEVIATIHSIEGMAIEDYADPIAGTNTMHGFMLFKNKLKTDTKVKNIIFNTGHIYHIVNFNSKLVKSTTDVAPPAGNVLINFSVLDISAAAIAGSESENVITITATPDLVVDGVASTTVAVIFNKGTNTASPLVKEVLEAGLVGSFMKSIGMSGTVLAQAVSMTPTDRGVVVEVTSKASVLTDPTVSLTINLKDGYKFADDSKTIKIRGIKTKGTIVAPPGGY